MSPLGIARYTETVSAGQETILERLQKVMAKAGVGSRRACEEMIRQGRVVVNDQVAGLGLKVDPRSDTIVVDGRPLPVGERKRYIAVNKPPGVLSVMVDGRGRPGLSSLVDADERLYPVGRLDLNSEGLVLLTNDGEIAHRLTHPRYGHPKDYLVLVEGKPSEAAIVRLQRGVVIGGQRTRPARVLALKAAPSEVASRSVAEGRVTTWLRVTLNEGRKRQIRHMCAAVGHPVLQLVRVAIGTLKLGSLRPGDWRDLKVGEVAGLRRSLGPRKREDLGE